jgi:subfamily B ATP-binding cassette protein MsbA
VRGHKSTIQSLIEERREFAIIYRLIAVVRQHLWFLPAMMALALLSALFEGFSLALVIPLIYALDQSAIPVNQGSLLSFLYYGVMAIPAEARLLSVLAAIFAAVVLKSVIDYANMVVLGIVYGRLSHSLRISVFSKIVQMPLPAFERERSGRFLNVLNSETWRATDALNSLFMMITSASTTIVFITLLLVLSWRLTLLALLCVALMPPFIQVLALRVKKLSDHGLEANEALAKRTWTALNGLRVIHVFGRESLEVERFTQISDRVRHIFLRMAMISMTTGPITEVLVTGVVALLALMIDATHVPVATLVGFLAILYRLQPRILSFVSAQAKLLSLQAPVSEVMDVLTSRCVPSTGDVKRPFIGLRNSIRFEQVTFSHHGEDPPTLANVSFAIRHNSIFAIVGTSGAGKSTMLDLLLQFYEPQQGTIWIDEIPLGEIETRSWRSRLAVVSQDPYIFDDTVRANILYGRPDALDADIVEAARLACADDFIRELPKGYDTVVGERGTQISGGQRQRIALARALLRVPDVLILDEATNALDILTEQAFREALKSFARNRVVIIVAHRLAMVTIADHVVVLDRGTVIEQGNPRELLAAHSLLARMFPVYQSILADADSYDPQSGERGSARSGPSRE